MGRLLSAELLRRAHFPDLESDRLGTQWCSQKALERTLEMTLKPHVRLLAVETDSIIVERSSSLGAVSVNIVVLNRNT